MSLKRSAEDQCNTVQQKRVKCDINEESRKKETVSNDDCDKQYLSKPVPPLLTLSDEILLFIIQFLDPRDVINLGRACVRMSAVVRDRALWACVDLRRRPMMLCQLTAFLPFLRPSTRALLSRGPAPLPPPPPPPPAPTAPPSSHRVRDPRRCCPADALHALAAACPSLETLHAQRHCYDASKVNLTDFPSSLKKLDLEGCELQFISKDRSYFSGINKHMVLLQELVLDGCQWVSSDCFMAISKCPVLRRLSLRHCRNVGSGYVYLTLSTRFGFKALEELDVRGTALADHEVSCFQNVETLTHLLLEPPPLWVPREYSYHADECNLGAHSNRVPCSYGTEEPHASAALGMAEAVAEGKLGGEDEGVEEEEGEEEGAEACAWRGKARCECLPTPTPAASASGDQPPGDHSPPPASHPFSPPPHVPIVHINLFDPHVGEGAVATHSAEGAPPGECVCEQPDACDAAEDLVSRLDASDENSVGDRCLLHLGTRFVVELDGAEDAQPQLLRRNPRLRSLTVANCPRVTNAALRHLAMHEPLRFLDVRDTGVTAMAVAYFSSMRPDVTLLHSHDLEGCEDAAQP